MLYWIIRAILRPSVRVVYRPWVQGLEHLPSTGAVILASNHLSFLDSIFLPLMVPRRITFLAKQEYFTERGVKGRLKKAFFSGVGQVPINREDKDAANAALDAGKGVLATGAVLGIYPEGTRSPDGRLYRGKVGVAKMAVEAGVPVIPVAMIGMLDVQPPGRVVPKVARVGIKIGAPLDFSRYAGMAGDRFVLRSMTDEIMYELMVLSGQEYVDVYATKAKAEIALAREAADVSTVGSDGAHRPRPLPPRSAADDGDVAMAEQRRAS